MSVPILAVLLHAMLRVECSREIAALAQDVEANALRLTPDGIGKNAATLLALAVWGAREIVRLRESGGTRVPNP